MCGIAGIISRESIRRSSLVKMADRLVHRGPDDEGYIVIGSSEDDDARKGFIHKEGAARWNVGLSHRRLSIIDISSAGHQPMSYDGGRMWIVYNGEIYNYIELRAELEKLGAHFSTHSDTETILAAYKFWGEDALDHLNGMFAFAVFDAERRSVFCARDRFGVKPFYYTEVDGAFVFASEIKAFCELPGFRPALNESVAADFLRFGILDHGAETFFTGVQQLRGGEKLTFDLEKGIHRKSVWYDFRNRTKGQKQNLSSDAPIQYLAHFRDSIRLRLRADVKVGSCLSGGLDSSSIVCLVNQELRAQGAHHLQETVSSCFEDPAFDERPYIEEVTRATEAVSHRIFPDLESMTSVIDKILYHQDEPFASTSIFAQWCVFEKARAEKILVMLDGQGADEQLAGYHSYFGSFLIRLFLSFRWPSFLREAVWIRRRHGWSVRRIGGAIAGALIPASWLNWYRGSKARAGKGPGNPFVSARAASVSERSMMEILHTSLPMLLHYEDRNSMAHSVEARVPFLDYRVVEFTACLPAAWKIRNGETKVVLRRAMEGILPEKLLNRQDKMGFVTPERKWMESHHHWIEAEIGKAHAKVPHLVQSEFVKSVEESARRGRYGDPSHWRAAVFGRWLEVFRVHVGGSVT